MTGPTKNGALQEKKSEGQESLEDSLPLSRGKGAGVPWKKERFIGKKLLRFASAPRVQKARAHQQGVTKGSTATPDFQ